MGGQDNEYRIRSRVHLFAMKYFFLWLFLDYGLRHGHDHLVRCRLIEPNRDNTLLVLRKINVASGMILRGRNWSLAWNNTCL